MSEVNPYEAPAADLVIEPAADNFEMTNPRAVSIGHGWGWIADGFDHFSKNPGTWILMMFVGMIMMIVLALVPIVGQFTIMGTTYVWIGGIIIGCRAQDRGEELKLEHLFAGFTSKPLQLIFLSVFMSVIGLTVLVVAMGPVYLELMTMGSQPDPEVMQKLTDKMADPGVFLRTYVITLLCSIPLYMTIWFAPALIVLNDVPVFRAMKLSFIGCLKNILPFLLYFIVGFFLYILSALPLLLGLLVSIPVLFASLYTSYTDIFIER